MRQLTITLNPGIPDDRDILDAMHGMGRGNTRSAAAWKREIILEGIRQVGSFSDWARINRYASADIIKKELTKPKSKDNVDSIIKPFPRPEASSAMSGNNDSLDDSPDDFLKMLDEF